MVIHYYNDNNYSSHKKQLSEAHYNIVVHCICLFVCLFWRPLNWLIQQIYVKIVSFYFLNVFGLISKTEQVPTYCWFIHILLVYCRSTV